MTDTADNSDEHGYGRDQVVQIINSVISKVEHHDDEVRETMFQELKELKGIIEDARSDLGRTKPVGISDKDIPTATDELDAVVAETADATGKIMDACEVIQNLASEIGGDQASSIENEVIKIFEACSFQDITGQRITKVVSTLKKIEEKVDQFTVALGMDSGESSSDEDERSGDEALLNGPQMADQAISQEEIDRLLEEFD